jgi:Fe-S-cluster containining protein
MIPEYQEILKKAKQNQKAIRNTVRKLRSMRKGVVDDIIQPLHEEAFQEIDCLKCANCCKTTSPILIERDIQRIAKHLKMKPADFTQKYVFLDKIDQEYALKETPCPFLGEDHYCGIYEVRPKACAAYPHTDQVNQLGILSLTEKNASICPAVAVIFEKLLV